MGTFKKLLSRVRSEQVRERYADWMTYAKEFYSDSQAKSALGEEGYWTDATEESGQALRDLDRWTTRTVPMPIIILGPQEWHAVADCPHRKTYAA